MVFGDSERFAIELDLCTDPAGLWMNGMACYWISGEQVGDFGMVDSLRDVLFCWERMSFDSDRSNEELFHLNPQDLLDTLYSGLYNSSHVDQEVLHQRGITETWARHNINPGTVAFSGWFIFLVEDNSSARCLYARNINGLSNYSEQPLGLGEFNQILGDTIAYLLKEYRRLGGR